MNKKITDPRTVYMGGERYVLRNTPELINYYQIDVYAPRARKPYHTFKNVGWSGTYINTVRTALRSYQ